MRLSLPDAVSAPLRRLPLPGRSSSGRVVLEIDLGRGLAEAPPASPVEALRSRHTPLLRALVDALRKAVDDDAVVAVVVHVGHREPSLAQAEELRTALLAVRAAGKPTVAWSESYGEMAAGNVGYLLASACEEVWVQPSGDVGLVGIAAESVFLRGSLDKLGVEPQIGQRHEYKTAADTFLQTSMTAPHREMMQRLVESAMESVVRGIASARELTEEQVRAAVERAPLTAEEALAAGLVDKIGYRDEVYAALRRRTSDADVRYADRRGRASGALASALDSLRPAGGPLGGGREVIALVQASGPIHLGRGSGSSLGGRSVGADSLGATLRAAAADDSVAAVVLRIDSPGGSYVASDALRREVLAVRRSGKPVVASMATVAASGGYYLAMGADEIVANAGTLTGSIGVLAGKQVVTEAFERLGIRREGVATGRSAEMFSTREPFDEDEWRRLDGWLDRVYDDFTGKAAADRGMAVDDLRAVAKGRVWTGADALENGLVDSLGGLEHAVRAACRRAGIERDRATVKQFGKLHPLEALKTPENSDHPAAAGVLAGEGLPVWDRLLAATGLTSYGALSMPVVYRLR